VVVVFVPRRAGLALDPRVDAQLDQLSLQQFDFRQVAAAVVDRVDLNRQRLAVLHPDVVGSHLPSGFLQQLRRLFGVGLQGAHYVHPVQGMQVVEVDGMVLHVLDAGN
jgi:hypothetical protein